MGRMVSGNEICGVGWEEEMTRGAAQGYETRGKEQLLTESFVDISLLFALFVP